MRRIALVGSVLLAAGTLAGGVLPASGYSAAVPLASSTTIGPACANWGSQAAVALPSPRRAVGSIRGAGVVELRYRSGARWVASPLTSAMLGVPSQVDGFFGAAVAVVGVSASGCAGLVVGMPGANGGRGAVAVIPDNGNGLDLAAAAWLPTGPLALKLGDRLGAAVASGPTGCCSKGKGWTVIAAGAPGRDAAGAADAADAGAVVTWKVAWDDSETTGVPPAPLASGQPAAHVQGVAGMRGRAEARDRFGSVLADDGGTLVVGVPSEDIRSRRDAGAVARLSFTTSGAVKGNDMRWQGGGLPGTSRAGDRLGAAVLGPHIGIPGKDVRGRVDAGAILLWDSEAGKYRVITQRTRGIPGTPEKGDRFGAALAGFLQVGAPGEDIGRTVDAGSVTQVSPWSMSQSATLVVSGLAVGDRFGATVIHQADECGEDGEEMCRLTFIGAPGEDRPDAANAGRYYLLDSQASAKVALPFANGVAAGEGFGGFASLTPPPP